MKKTVALKMRSMIGKLEKKIKTTVSLMMTEMTRKTIKMKKTAMKHPGDNVSELEGGDTDEDHSGPDGDGNDQKEHADEDACESDNEGSELEGGDTDEDDSEPENDENDFPDGKKMRDKADTRKGVPEVVKRKRTDEASSLLDQLYVPVSGKRPRNPVFR